MDSDEAPDSPVAAVKRGRGRPKGQTKSGKPSAPKVPSGKDRGRPKGSRTSLLNKNRIRLMTMFE